MDMDHTLSPSSPPPPPAPISLTEASRHQSCPFLLKGYYQIGSFHGIDQFKFTSTPSIEHEILLYTWKDATLQELTDQIKEQIPEVFAQAIGDSGRVAFKHVYVDRMRGRMTHQDLGTVMMSGPSPAITSLAAIEGVSNTTTAAGVSAEDSAATPTDDQRRSAPKSQAWKKTLSLVNFQVGDYLDLAILTASDLGRKGDGRGSGKGQQDNAGGGGGPIRRHDRSGRSGGGDSGRHDRLTSRLGALNALPDNNNHQGSHRSDRDRSRKKSYRRKY